MKSIPQKLRNKFVEWSGNFVGLAATGLSGLNSLGSAAQRWAPAYREGLAEITRISQDMGWLNQKMNKLSGDSYVNVFRDPNDGDPFGFAFEYGVGNAGSFSYTNSVYYQL